MRLIAQAMGAIHSVLMKMHSILWDNLFFSTMIHSSPPNRVKNGSVVQINRQMGTTQFTIQIQEHTSIEGKYTLPRQFTVAYWDTDQKRLMRSVGYTDLYIPIEGYYLPSSRRIIISDDTGVHTHAIDFSSHKLP